MKTQEELNALRQELEKLNAKLAELTNEELAQVTGGVGGKGVNPTHFEYATVKPY